VEDWLAQQEAAVVATWEGAIDRHYPQHSEVWSDPDEHYAALTKSWNFLDALEYVDWDSLMTRSDLDILDLGAGTGWLSAYLSRLPNVHSVDALDSSNRNLAMIPRITEIMGGLVTKIRQVHGLFCPLPVASCSYDMIVASSAAHHASSLFDLLEECHRVLMDDGAFVILNETPDTRRRSVSRMLRMTARIGGRVAGGRYDRFSCSVSSAGLLYDPHLGDLAYSLAQWRDAFVQTGWACQTIRTPLGTYKPNNPKAPRLTHFILRKEPGARSLAGA
jgi:SAM-dependent methyltransferase